MVLSVLSLVLSSFRTSLSLPVVVPSACVLSSSNLLSISRTLSLLPSAFSSVIVSIFAILRSPPLESNYRSSLAPHPSSSAEPASSPEDSSRLPYSWNF
ncbi:hypothetical protein PUN28_019133 [Cardiocondyla obscurior]|uniref:Secreted protein n=1 Tax=Cardiocondyla obscurior TaxID=286306 RepID=A0AAW2EG99_9HYME